jgi:hypothetical protein
MFFRKVAVMVLCCLCATAIAYAQRSLPEPQDPEKVGTMMLTRTDMRLKAQAEDYLNKGNLDDAVQTLQGISNQWVSHWFLSYAYEMNLLYKEALSENDWLLQKSQAKTLRLNSLRENKCLKGK